MNRPRTYIAALSALFVLLPASAQAAAVRTDRSCYRAGQPMGISGSGWAPGSSWAVGSVPGGVSGGGTADAAGNWASVSQRAPSPGFGRAKPKKFKLNAAQNNLTITSTKFRTVNFGFKLRKSRGKPTRKTKWSFAGFRPGKKIYLHVKRGKKVWREKVGKAKTACGIKKKRIRRLPAVPKRKVRTGGYKIYADNHKKFKKGRRRQVVGTLRVFKTFK